MRKGPLGLTYKCRGYHEQNYDSNDDVRVEKEAWNCKNALVELQYGELDEAVGQMCNDNAKIQVLFHIVSLSFSSFIYIS